MTFAASDITPNNGNAARPSVLLIEDSFALSETYHAYLKTEGYDITCVEAGGAAMDIINRNPPDVVVLDVHLPDMNGIEMLKDLRARAVPTDVIIITGQASVNLAVDAMREGAVDFIMKPFTAERLRVTVRNAAQRRKLTAKIEEIQEELHRDKFFGFVGRSPAMQTVYQTLKNAAGSDATAFVRGESGTGKELCAEALHKLSPRSTGPLIAMNCAAIPRDLLESEIFGHVRGAFTGATRDRKGATMRAHGGTLFLDEICEMDLALQSKLLRFIQERTVQRVGEDVVHPCDVRIVCATNRDPMEEVRAGRFREDLFYRLHVVPIILPPLRDRGDDVLLIAKHFLKLFAHDDGKSFTGFAPDAERALMTYRWPGNVRQLQNLVRQMVVMNAGGVIDRAQLPAELATIGQSAGPSGVHLTSKPTAPAIPVYREVLPSAYPDHALKTSADIQALDDVIRQTVNEAVEICGGSIPQAARALDVSPSTLYRRLQSWEMADARLAEDQGHEAA